MQARAGGHELASMVSESMQQPNKLAVQAPQRN
ncbi:hypothetical protein HG15A2_12810 [Adhaeretor mobilis]|uniref:Uncharacterized protein n=1 Tax=Adhaeretor mobilis TaxID=1930276 RepID=A0A517MT01_9BACT|nr:hypothetical protein HG15A2_12810 [Adhaeretor mobilis]